MCDCHQLVVYKVLKLSMQLWYFIVCTCKYIAICTAIRTSVVIMCSDMYTHNVHCVAATRKDKQFKMVDPLASHPK